MDIASSHFIANTADLGGALYLSSVTSGRVIDCVFQDNDARPDAGQVADAFHTQDGGAIYLFGGQNMDILGGTFSNNSAFASGGAINSWQLSGALNIDGCIFDSCQAGSSLGSVLYVYGGLERITSVFLRNSHISGSLGSTSVSVRSAGCLGVINTTIGNSDQLGLSAVDMGGQCDPTFMQEPVLLHRDTISSDPAYSDSVYESIGADISVCVFR